MFLLRFRFLITPFLSMSTKTDIEYLYRRNHKIFSDNPLKDDNNLKFLIVVVTLCPSSSSSLRPFYFHISMFCSIIIGPNRTTLFVIFLSFGNLSWLPANCVVWIVGISNILFSETTCVMELLNCKKACAVDRKLYMVIGGRRGRSGIWHIGKWIIYFSHKL